MEIFVLRHGEAEPQTDRDQYRQLTERGYAEVAATLKRAQPRLDKVQKILVSPYTRAQQTADIASDLLPGRMLMTVEELVPNGNLQQLGDLLDRLGLERVLLVSHQPLVGSFVGWLCGLEPGRYRMGTSALALIETDVIEAGCGHLRWMKQPGI